MDRNTRHDRLIAVMNAPVQIRKPEVAERLRTLARREGRSITDLVDEMAREREERTDKARQAEIDQKIAAVNEIVREFNALPILGPLLTDDDIYDEDGLPK
ncbi:MAG: type II toxin-antitoxin system VapB family antitoxin [Brevundimonas sp.]|uniref:type II toxin-antitoxin system VapB family antitoxin n=1 Tax=Brevundimonas sp. TaxID=1871086 RepID=UPI002566C15D|nr:type II toxin-antitoxin system VapB family antitoxin [Brevundimonas sp.]MDK2748319.1 type II toxin-antitoxin system VapB family antitoxin [Brevundimonas sp.]